MAKYALTVYRFEKMIPLSTVYASGVTGRKRAVQIINNQHCKYMVLSGTCTTVCNNCKAALEEVFMGMDPKVSSNPWGLFTYRVRTARTRMIEGRVVSEKTAPVSDVGKDYGEKTTDPLDALENMLQ